MTDVIRVVQAAGGVVWRPGPEILLVHRPRYDDWSLPKGKLDPGEHLLSAAVREVFEETGIRAVPATRLAPVRYLTGEPGVEKQVTYWTMRPADDIGHDPTDEVDELAWLRLADAQQRLTYVHDRGVLAAFAALPVVTATLVLVRHARAGHKSDWAGADLDRPLDPQGRRDAEHAGSLLRLFAPARVVSAPARRCRDTVAGAGRPVDVDGRFAEDADVGEALAALREYARTGATTVVCSQGGLLRPLVARLRAASGTATVDRVETPKGAGWVLSYTAGAEVFAVDPLDLRVTP
jgi:8-oxo-dGTP pyrophosphatase MutT (NUDIX family)/phosphohistidine phosphatase SixA